jgi:excisionase family DNA binding protein
VLTDPQNYEKEPSALLTVEEAARVLRIGRTAAYELARRDLATDGGEGLRVVRVGRLLRVPRAALEDLIGGPFTIPANSPTLAPAPQPNRSSSAKHRQQRSTQTDQASLPFAS